MPTDEPTSAPTPPQPSRDGQILGLSTDSLAGLSVDELTGNKVAITMVMHYYRNLVDENTALKNDRNTLQTYVEGYRIKKTHAAIGAVLLLISNVGISFGINLLTGGSSWAGGLTLIPGLCVAAAGAYFSLKEN